MRYLINLFPAKEQTTLDKTMYFAFHYLRYILVITQFVVICVFFYRFKVDQEIVDLKDGLQQKQQIVVSTQSLIDEVKVMSGRLTNVKTVFAEQQSSEDIYVYFFERVPQQLNLSKVFMADKSLTIEGVTDDSNSVRMFYDLLKREKRFKEVNLLNMRKTDTGYTFSLKLVNFQPSKL